MSSTRTQTTSRTPKARLKSTEDGSKGIWSQLLDSVGSGKRLAEKNVIILGGSPDSQRQFLDSLAYDSQRRGKGGSVFSKRPPVANRFALGYTYQDILDADQDDILARLSLYMLSNPKMSYTCLLEPLLDAKAISNTLVIILLDWAHPWTWMRELRSWTRLLRATLSGLDAECKEALEENTKEWSERRRGPAAEGAGVERPTSSEGTANLPLGPGECDEHLGLPVCVVAQGAEKIETYEKDHNWGDEEFDTILQYLRAALLKHGASLMYSNSTDAAVTTAAAPATEANAPQTGPAILQSLVRGSLDIHSLLQKNSLKHNVIDRDRILVPPSWDSWGKIRVLRERFDVESVADAWSYDIQVPKIPSSQATESSQNTDVIGVSSESSADHLLVHESPEQSAVTLYEAAVRDPNPSPDASSSQRDIDTVCPPNQDFFTAQATVLDKLKGEDDAANKAREAKQTTSSTGVSKTTGQQGTASTGNAARDIGGTGDAKVSEHIGPVQFNMGGIQVDADDALKTLRNAAAARSPQPRTPAAGTSTPGGRTVPIWSPASEVGEQGESAGEEKAEDESEKLKSFFAGLMTKSNAGTPKSKSDAGSGGTSTPSRG